MPNPALARPAVSLSTPPAVPEQLSYAQLLGLWQRAGASYGIPWPVLAAINKVESNFGRNMGPSSAGAIGWMQFMPSTWLRWGADSNGDGIADPWNPKDAVFSAARYLAAAGGAHRHLARLRVQPRPLVRARGAFARRPLGGDSTLAFSLDGMQQNLDAARSDVAHRRAGDRCSEGRARRVACRRSPAGARCEGGSPLRSSCA